MEGDPIYKGMLSMANKKNTANGEQRDSAPNLGELDQLRQIVFGEAQQALVDKIETMRANFEKSLASQDQKFSNELVKMKESFEQQLATLDQRLQLFDKTHDEHEATIQKDLDNLASEHEMFATSTEESFKGMAETLNTESTSLSTSFNEQLTQLEAHLEEVSRELSSSKTDRKTLAKLLATMATNLEAEQM